MRDFDAGDMIKFSVLHRKRAMSLFLLKKNDPGSYSHSQLTVALIKVEL